MTAEHIFTIIAVVALLSCFGWFGFQAVKNGGLRGAVLGARIKRTVGQVEPSYAMAGKTILRVNQLETSGNYIAVGIEVVNRTMLSYSLQGFSLSKDEATKLAGLLLEASGQAA